MNQQEIEISVQSLLARCVRKGRGGKSRKSKNVVVVLFCRGLKMAMVLEDRIEIGKKINFHLRFSYVNIKVSQKFQILIGFSPNAQIFAINFLNFF